MQRKFQARTQTAFARAVDDMDAAINTMMADHSAKGRLQSGATIIRALEIYEMHSRQALEQTLGEAAKLIEHRGRKWSAAMDGIAEALEHQLSQAQEYLAKARRVADRENSPSISPAIDEHLAGIALRLRGQLADFRDGWTAPVPKLWKDRHPLIFQFALLIFGAAVALAASYAAGLLHLN